MSRAAGAGAALIRATSLLVVLTVWSGCATSAWSSASPTRAFHVTPGTTLVVHHERAELGPAAKELQWLDPLACFALHCQSGDWLCAMIGFGCICVAGAVDAVILPVQAVSRWADRQELQGIAEACGLPDPASRVAEDLAAGLTRDFELAAAPAGPAGAPGEALVLEIRTLEFTHSAGLRWHGELALRLAGSSWIDACDQLAPPRDRTALQSDCEGARKELEVLASACVSGALRRLHADEWREPAKPEPPAVRER